MLLILTPDNEVLEFSPAVDYQDLNIDQEIDDPIYARYKPIDQQEIPSGGNINFASGLNLVI